MTGEWRAAPLGELVELKRTSDLLQRTRSPAVVPVVSPAGISDYHAESMVADPGVVTVLELVEAGVDAVVGEQFLALPQDA